MKFDERFVNMLRTDPDISAIVGNRVYLIEVLQSTSTTPYNKYPSIVYQISESNPLRTLCGLSGEYRTNIMVMCFSQSAAQLRALTEAITALAYAATIADANGFDWISANDNSDDWEIPFQYDEKAMKSATVSVTLMYQSSGET